VRLGQLAQRAYRASEIPLAFLLILVALAPQLLPVGREVTAAALSALGFILLGALFRIERSINRLEYSPRTYNEFYEVASEMRNVALSEVGDRGVIEVQALGISMDHAWPFFAGLIDTILSTHSSQRIALELAMLDPTWPELPNLPSSRRRLSANLQDIHLFYSRHQDVLKSGRLVMTLRLYRHMPNWHGVCVSGHTLFLSISTWANGNLLASGNPYQRFRRKDELGATQAFSTFESWFGHIRTYPDALLFPDGEA